MDIKNRIIFEYLLRFKGNEKIILSMLNAILFPGGDNKICHFSFNWSDMSHFFTTRGASAYPYVFVLNCEDKNNEKVHIEILFEYLQYGMQKFNFETLYEFNYRLDSKRKDCIN